ncbi:MAG: T9SS type A sorting domain-containing protein [bacterium]
MRAKLFSMVLFPILVCAQVHTVPLGTAGNKLIYTVKNSTSHTLYSVGVFVESYPEWIAFDNNTVMIDSLNPHCFYEAAFWFDSRSGEVGQTGAVLVGLMDDKGEIISQKILTFCAALQTNESRLYPSYPNPANPSTTVRFSLTEPAEVKITAFNILGQAVKTLADKSFSAGLWEIPWQGDNSFGQPVASGLYIIKLKTVSDHHTRNWSVKVNLQH